MTPEQPDLRLLIETALPGCRPQTWTALVETARFRKFHPNCSVFRQGEPVPLTFLTSGYCAFRRTTVEGQQVTVRIAGPRELFGFASIASTHASGDLVALTDCDIALWDGRAVRQLAAGDPAFALFAIDRMAAHLNTTAERVDGFLHQDARRRVVRVLARHRDLFFANPAILSRRHLPDLVGTSREMTGRVLRELEREGTIVRIGRSGLRLLRPDRLEVDVSDAA